MYTKEEITLTLDDKRKRALEIYPGQVCRNCHKPVIYLNREEIVNFKEAVFEGHIYSPEGLDEFRISRTCEYCFDKICEEFENEQ